MVIEKLDSEGFSVVVFASRHREIPRKETGLLKLPLCLSVYSNLTQRLTCAQQGVGGCLQWQIDEAAARVNNTVKLENEMDDCNIDSSVTDYSTVCVAQEPCSLAPALECFELDEEADTTDCG